MATLREIKRRISGVKSTQKITKAMKVVATTRLKKYEVALSDSVDYFNELKEILHELARSGEGFSHPLMAKSKDTKTIGVVVIASDRGLCGSFNSMLFRQTETFLEENFPGKNINLYLIGSKAEQFYKSRERKIIASIGRLSDEERVVRVRELVGQAMADYQRNEVAEVHLIFNHYESRSNFGFKALQLFPFDQDQFLKDVPEKKGSTYLVEPSIEECLDYLIPLLIQTLLRDSVLQSQTAEELSRMLAMDYATENANELIGDLTLQFNRKRQEVITTEISEIVGGSEALE